MTTAAIGRSGYVGGVLGRGTVLSGGLGGVLGGIAASCDWLVVGTFFGAGEGAIAGAVVGAGGSLLLLPVLRSRWAVRGVAGGLAAVMGVSGLLSYSSGFAVPTTVAVLLVAVGAVASAAGGPLVAYGLDPASRRRAVRALQLLVGGGGLVGAGLGSVVGLGVGVDVYLPTAPLAAVEGAILGAVSGLILGALLAAVWVLPRLRSRW